MLAWPTASAASSKRRGFLFCWKLPLHPLRFPRAVREEALTETCKKPEKTESCEGLGTPGCLWGTGSKTKPKPKRWCPTKEACGRPTARWAMSRGQA